MYKDPNEAWDQPLYFHYQLDVGLFSDAVVNVLSYLCEGRGSFTSPEPHASTALSRPVSLGLGPRA